jgi:hypothetical protein
VILATSTNIRDCAVMRLSRSRARDGHLAEHPTSCPFAIRRVYYLFDVPAGAVRGGHAHHALHQLVIAARGSFDVLLDDGRERRTVTLDNPAIALHLVPGIWRELLNFSAGSICLVMASAPFDEADYLRDYGEFVAFKGGAAAR